MKKEIILQSCRSHKKLQMSYLEGEFDIVPVQKMVTLHEDIVIGIPAEHEEVNDDLSNMNTVLWSYDTNEYITVVNEQVLSLLVNLKDQE